jgi:hypothetical protein
MVARATNNLNAFGHTNGIAQDVEMFTIDAGATLATETNPGEAMDAITKCIEEFSNIIAVGTEDGAGGFRIMLHGGKWTAASLQAALQALGASVGANGYNMSAATVADYVF